MTTYICEKQISYEIINNAKFTYNSNYTKFVTQSRTGLQIYEGHDDQLNRPGPMA
jgi:hypothetical protein